MAYAQPSNFGLNIVQIRGTRAEVWATQLKRRGRFAKPIINPLSSLLNTMLLSACFPRKSTTR